MRRVVELAVKNLCLTEPHFPSINILKSCGRAIGAHRLDASEFHFLMGTEGRDAIDFRSWLENTVDETVKFRLYGCFGWEEHAFRIDREFVGFSIYFPNMSDAVKFKLAWADDCIRA